MTGGLELGAVADVQEDLGGGLDADPRHAHQDPGEREVVQHGLDFLRHCRPLLLQLFHLTSDSGYDELHCGGRRDDDRLLAERGEGPIDQRFRIPAGVGASEPQNPAPAYVLKPGRAAELLQQVQDEPGGQAAADKDALERRVDLSQQGPDPVQRPGGLVGEVLIEAGEDLERRENLVVAVDLAKRVVNIRVAGAR